LLVKLRPIFTVFGKKSFLSDESDTKILQSTYFAYEVGMVSSYSNRIKFFNANLSLDKALNANFSLDINQMPIFHLTKVSCLVFSNNFQVKVVSSAQKQLSTYVAD